MDSPLPFPVILLLGAFLVAALGVYQNLLRSILSGGGKVRTAELQFPDLLISVFLAGLFVLLIARTLLRHEAPPASMHPDQVLPSASFFLLLLVGIVAFLRYRRIDLSRLFGLDRMRTARAFAIALGLIIAAFPLVVAAGYATQLWMPGTAREQEMVTLFRDVVRRADHATVAQILVAGLIVAPVAEEFLFRGYFYPVFKRYLGPVAATLLTAGLFAAFHLNLASLLSLFVLALCFTVAYEASGSLAVPIGMHMLFNLTQLAYLYLDAQAA